MYTGCVDSLYRGRRGPPYRIGHAEPFGTSRYEANLYIVEPPLDPVLQLAYEKYRKLHNFLFVIVNIREFLILSVNSRYFVKR